MPCLDPDQGRVEAATYPSHVIACRVDADCGRATGLGRAPRDPRTAAFRPRSSPEVQAKPAFSGRPGRR